MSCDELKAHTELPSRTEKKQAVSVLPYLAAGITFSYREETVYKSTHFINKPYSNVFSTKWRIIYSRLCIFSTIVQNHITSVLSIYSSVIRLQTVT